MLKSKRQNEIVEILKSNGFVSVSHLSDMLFASESSIRRDLAELDKRRIIKRSYGGAELITAKTNVVNFGTRSYDYVEQKRVIAQKAARLINEGDVIFLDQSSTCYFLALELERFNSLTVVTNNIEILNVLSTTRNTVYSTGGVISKQNNNCLIGSGASQTFLSIYADKMFFSTSSVSADGVITDRTIDEIYLRNSMLKNAAKKVFLCNSEKLNTTAPFIQCSLNDIDTVVCESDAFLSFNHLFKNLEIL